MIIDSVFGFLLILFKVLCAIYLFLGVCCIVSVCIKAHRALEYGYGVRYSRLVAQLGLSALFCAAMLALIIWL